MTSARRAERKSDTGSAMRGLYPTPALGGREFQPFQVLADRIAESLAARHGGAAGHHQNEIPARRAADLLDVAHVDQAGAADAQHGLRLERLLSLLQGAPGVKGVAADRQPYVVAVSLHHLHLRH